MNTEKLFKGRLHSLSKWADVKVILDGLGIYEPPKDESFKVLAQHFDLLVNGAHNQHPQWIQPGELRFIRNQLDTIAILDNNRYDMESTIFAIDIYSVSTAAYCVLK